jgi:TP53 regulating kinase-like protein
MLPAALEALMGTIGRTLAVLHDGGLIHGDLTTSNMIVRASDKALVSCTAAAGTT